MGLTVLAVFRLTDKSVKPHPDSRGGVLHSLRVFQYPEALVGILHGGCPIGIRGNWQRGNLQWERQDYFSMATWPVENTTVNSVENLSFSRTVITPSSSSSILSTTFTACQKAI